MKIRKTLLSFLVLMATATMMLSCGSKKDSLSGTKWQATEHNEIQGGIVNLSIEFYDDSTGNFCLESWDLGDGLTDQNIDYPLTYTYDKATKKGRIQLKGDENIYPFSLNDTALIYPSVFNWEPVAYKQIKK